jgi:hypothetical protein
VAAAAVAASSPLSLPPLGLPLPVTSSASLDPLSIMMRGAVPPPPPLSATHHVTRPLPVMADSAKMSSTHHVGHHSGMPCACASCFMEAASVRGLITSSKDTVSSAGSLFQPFKSEIERS